MLTPTSGTLADYLSAILGGNATEAKLVFPVQNITIDGNDIAADGGIVLNSILNSDTDLQMGKAVMTECVVHLLNSSKFASFDWTEEFELQMGVSISGTTNWVTVGYFTGSKPERIKRQEIIEFTAYDRMSKFDCLADDFISTLTFPRTITQIYSALCTYVGITSESGDQIANVMSMSFAENPFMSGMTCRGILSAIAEANCCYARIQANGKVKLKWFSNQTSNYSVDGDDYFSVNVDEDSVPAIDYVRVGCTYDDNITGFVYPVGASGEAYQILDNPFLLNLSSANLTTACTAIYNRLAAFGSYTPMSIDIVGNWMVETGDIIEVDVDGTAYNLPIFVRSLQWNGGCGDAYESTGKATRTEVSEDTKQQYETGGKLANKYTIRSGVDITDEGVTISGGKYLKLISGGVLDVQATNFKIDSANKTFSAGNWVFTTNGFTLTSTIKDTSQNNHKLGFAIGNATQPSGTETFAYITFGGDAGLTDVLPYMAFGFKRASSIGFAPAYFKIRQFSNNTISIYSDTDNLNLGYPSASLNGDPGGLIKNLYVEQIGDSNSYSAVNCKYGYFNNIGGPCNQMYYNYTSDVLTWASAAVTPANCEYTVYKWGRIVVLRMKVYIKSAISNTTTTIGTLTSDYRPATRVYGTLSSPNQAAQYVEIRTDGTIRIRNASASSGDTTCYYLTMMFFTAVS